MIFKYKKLTPEAIPPLFATEGAACFDLSSIATQVSGDTVTCTTGLAFEVPEGHVMLVFSRSGMGFKHGIRLANCTGVVDHGYAGEVMVKLTSDEAADHDSKPPEVIKAGMRIAQAMIIPVESCDFEVVEQMQLTERGAGGFGSTGVAS